MGVILSRFSECHRALKEKEYDSIFNKVKLVCVVINNTWHKDVAKRVSNDHHRLIKETGNELLYIAFDGSSRGGMSGNECYCNDEDSLHKRFAMESSFNDDELIGYIREVLDYRCDQSFILISSDVRSGDALIMPTDAESIENQLIDLGWLCTNGGDIDIDDQRIQEISKTIRVSIPISLLELLTDVTALNEIANNDTLSIIPPDKKTPRRHANDAYLRTKTVEWNNGYDVADRYKRLIRVATSKSRDEEDSPIAFHRRNTFCLELSFDVFEPHNTDLNFGECYKIDDFEKFVKAFGYNTIMSYVNYGSDISCINTKLKRFRELSNLYDEDTDFSDFSQPVEDLYKITQETLNLSVSQLIRRCLGVPIPEYYNKWYEANIEGITTKSKTIYFNSHDNYKNWRGPALGELHCALDVISNENMFANELSLFPIVKNRGLINILPDINQTRNSCAHNGARISEERFRMTYFAFVRYIKYVPELINLMKAIQNGA